MRTIPTRLSAHLEDGTCDSAVACGYCLDDGDIAYLKNDPEHGEEELSATTNQCSTNRLHHSDSARHISGANELPIAHSSPAVTKDEQKRPGHDAKEHSTKETVLGRNDLGKVKCVNQSSDDGADD
jgi:hypothetical protein